MEIKDFLALKTKIKSIITDMQTNIICKERVIEISEKIKGYIDNGILSSDTNKTTEKINFSDFEFISQFENAIINYIDRSVSNITVKPNQQYSTPVARAVSYIEDNYKEDITLESCAECVSISYTHLSRIFKKETSYSFSKYLNYFRVSKAKILLAEKKLSIKQIVKEAGFTNYNYFFTIFKEIEGITPIEFIDDANN